MTLEGVAKGIAISVALFLLLLPPPLHSRGKVLWTQIEKNVEPPWLTGPLIAPSSHVVPLGHVNIEPYIFATAYTGNYSSQWKVIDSSTIWNNSLQIQFQVGLASWLDFQFIPTLSWNYSHPQAAWTLGDIPFGFHIQLYNSPQDSWIPSFKLGMRANLPIGKYRNLNPQKLGTDDGGNGSWGTGIDLVFGNLYHFTGVYYLSYRMFLGYIHPPPIRVTGFNVHGGGYGTDARFFPPGNFIADLGLEITLAQTWAFALDVIGGWAEREHFSGTRGVDATGRPAQLGRGSQAQFSLAPAIEYNWNANMGVIGGVWWTVAGRDAPVFTSVVIALNYYK